MFTEEQIHQLQQLLQPINSRLEAIAATQENQAKTVKQMQKQLNENTKILRWATKAFDRRLVDHDKRIENLEENMSIALKR